MYIFEIVALFLHKFKLLKIKCSALGVISIQISNKMHVIVNVDFILKFNHFYNIPFYYYN